MDPTAEPAPPANVTTKLLLGDCMDIMKALIPGQVALVAADLPYGVTKNKWDTPLDLVHLWRLLNRVAEQSATFAFHAQQPFLTTLICSNKNNFRYDLVWQKNRMAGYLSAKRAPLRAHESIAIFGRTKKYTPQMRLVDKPTVKVSAGRNPKVSGTTGVACKSHVVGQLRYPISILPFDREDKRNGLGHPTQKPVALLSWLIKSYTFPGDTVLDPCAGSFTTAIAALRTGRHCICIERDRTYYDIGVRRVAEERARLRLPPM